MACQLRTLKDSVTAPNAVQEMEKQVIHKKPEQCLENPCKAVIRRSPWLGLQRFKDKV